MRARASATMRMSMPSVSRSTWAMIDWPTSSLHLGRCDSPSTIWVTPISVATEIGVTQIVLGESHRPRWRELVGQSIIAHVLRETDGIDILIVADARARMENLDAGQDG